MIITAPFRERSPRLGIFAAALGAGLLVLWLAMFRVQVVRHADFGSREQTQSLRRIRIPSARGEIVDRNGIILADNRPSADVVIYLDQLGAVSKRQNIISLAATNLARLSQTLGVPVNLTERDIKLHYQRRRPLPLPVWKNLSPQMVAAFSERASNIPGIDLTFTPIRRYPYSTLAANILGYCGRANASDEEEIENFSYYQPDFAGKQGLERACDEFLRGEPGGKTIRVNPGGRTVAAVAERPTTRGAQVALTIDARYQTIVERALHSAILPAGKELHGAAVVLDPRNGEILAMASAPTFDPNIFAPGSPASVMTEVLTNPASPMLNRAIGARYAPGSTFKPITLLAGLESGKVHSTDTANCAGGLQIGNRFFGCWNRHGHGSVDAMAAMRLSCDVWFYQRGMATGVEAIAAMAREFGLGEPTGWDGGGEVRGLVPTPDWKRAKMGERWWDGDTAQMSIGQSFLLVTPLQMACAAAAIGNRGTVWRPFIVKYIYASDGVTLRETAPKENHRVRATPQNIEMVRRAMLGAIQSADGTGHHAAVRGVSVAGKTGTAEFRTPTGMINRAWFIGFAPYDQPTVAVAVLIEDGNSGGHTAAPVAGDIFAGIFGTSKERGSGGGGD